MPTIYELFQGQKAKFAEELHQMAERLQKCSECLTRAAERQDREPLRAALRGMVDAWKVFWEECSWGTYTPYASERNVKINAMKAAVESAEKVLDETDVRK